MHAVALLASPKYARNVGHHIQSMMHAVALLASPKYARNVGHHILVRTAAICTHIAKHRIRLISPPSIWHPSHYPAQGRRVREQGAQSASPMPALGSLQEKCRKLNTHKKRYRISRKTLPLLICIPIPNGEHLIAFSIS